MSKHTWLLITALGAAGCTSLSAGGGVYVPTNGAPSRVVGGSLDLGGFYGFKSGHILDLNTGFLLAPLEDSRALFTIGGKLISKSRGWRPGYYGMAKLGFPKLPAEEEGQPTEPAVEGSVWSVGGGVAWTVTQADSLGNNNIEAYASIQLGLVASKQEQEALGRGAFFGLQLTLTAGGDVLNAIYKGTDGASKE